MVGDKRGGELPKATDGGAGTPSVIISGFDDDAIQPLCQNGIMYADGESWEV